MKKRKNTHYSKQLLERVFRITRKDNNIDLSGSVAIVNGKTSEANFETEVYQVTFSTGRSNFKKQYSVFMSPSESIPTEEIEALKKTLGIEISGDGSLFRVESFEKDFKITFDLHNSISIDNLGVILFRKSNTEKRNIQIPFRKRKTKPKEKIA